MNRKSHILSLVIVNFFILGLLLSTGVLLNKTVTASRESVPLTNRHCVVIDPGHGGVDGGATSCTGVLESKLNLDISLKLDALLHLLGVDTQLIRKSDISVYTKGDSIAAKKVSDLKNRVAIINSVPSAALISIHQNHFTDSRYSGAQVFYARDHSSKRFAEEMQSALNTGLNPTGKRQAKKADGIYIMENIQCPGILIECGFLSNPQEEALLCNEDYQRKLCCAIAVTVLKYVAETGKA